MAEESGFRCLGNAVQGSGFRSGDSPIRFGVHVLGTRVAGGHGQFFRTLDWGFRI